MQRLRRVNKHDWPVQATPLQLQRLLHNVEELGLLASVTPAPTLRHRGLQQVVLVDLELVASVLFLDV